MKDKDFNPASILFFDTETTGFRPGNICQLSYLIINGQDILPNNFYFRVDYVEPGAERIHGLSVDKLASLSNNKSFSHSFSKIKSDFSRVDLLVGHNLNFDLGFIRAEFARCNSDFAYDRGMCTMRYFTNICKIPGSNGRGYKWPRLEELTNFFKISHKEIIRTTESLFNSGNTSYHDARFDTVATYLSYLKAREKGLIRI